MVCRWFESSHQQLRLSESALLKIAGNAPAMKGTRTKVHGAGTPEKTGTRADVAQLVERLPCKQRVAGSNPVISSIGIFSSVGQSRRLITARPSVRAREDPPHSAIAKW